MLRILMATIAVAALALPAAAYTTTWDGAQDGDLTIELILNCYIQVLWQDSLIEFDGDYDEPHDYWCYDLMGTGYALVGHPDNKFTATDAWAGDGAPFYFEARDGAYLYVKSNNALSMNVHTNGWLKATDPDCPDCYIPTYFTVALSGPFLVEGQDIGMGQIPNNGNGVYLYPDPEGNAGGEFDKHHTPGGIYPDQWAFDCNPASQTWHLGPLCPYVEGNMMFLARILRSGMADAGGNYTTWLDVSFASPDF